MILGNYPELQRVANIQRAHIWPKHTGGKGLDIFGMLREDVCSNRNYFLFQAEVEYQFDRKKIILVPTFSDGNIHFKLVVLYKAILESELVIRNHSKSKSQAIMWTDLHNKRIRHDFNTNGCWPFMRLIAQHTFAALKKAQNSDGAIAFTQTEYSCIKDGAIKLAKISFDDSDTNQTVRNVLKFNGYN
jgi:hypothetical protein